MIQNEGITHIPEDDINALQNDKLRRREASMIPQAEVDYPTIGNDHDCMLGECTHMDGMEDDFPKPDPDWWLERRERDGRY